MDRLRIGVIGVISVIGVIGVIVSGRNCSRPPSLCVRTHDKPPHGCPDNRFHITRFSSRQVSYIVIRGSGEAVMTSTEIPRPPSVAEPNEPDETDETDETDAGQKGTRMREVTNG
jgi:hypothetical protein